MNCYGLVSIISPSYNSLAFIKATYESIRSQTYTDWEWLITDDCSTDGTWEYITELSVHEPRVKPVRNNKNSGAARSRNSSIMRAKGRYLAFLDSDDVWLPEKLSEHLAFMVKHEFAISFTPYFVIDEQGKDLNEVVDNHLQGDFGYNDMLQKKATMGCCTVIVDKTKFDDVYMPIIQAGQDYALWLKLLKQTKVATIFPKPMSKYRIVANSLSRNKLNKAKKTWKIYRDIEKLNFFYALYCFAHYAVRAFFKLNTNKL